MGDEQLGRDTHLAADPRGADPRARVTLDPDEAGRAAIYHLMNAAIGPRPVAWVSTMSADGVANLAPHSYTTVFSLEPPVVGFVSVVPVGDCFLILGEVVRVHVAADVWRDGRIVPELLQPVQRLAGSTFSRIGPTFQLPRPTYADVLAGDVARLPDGVR